MAPESLYLTILQQGNTIVMDLAEVTPIVPRGQLQIETGLLTEIGEELARITTLANKQAVLGTSGASVTADRGDGFSAALQRLGGLIFSHLFPASVRQRLADVAPTDLFLRLDDQLVHVPWELAFDGRDFLLMKFRIGRQVITHQRPASRRVTKPDDPGMLKMLIIADPTESLPAAAEEAEQLCDLLDTCSNLEVSIIGGKQLRKIDLLQALNECDLVHYAGHACFDVAQPGRSGWVLHDAVLTASELSRVTHPPLLVFSNACQAGATTRWQPEAIYEAQAFGIGSAFLLAGTQNYIGTFCVIHDTHSAAFAADVYQHLLLGKPLGAALAVARYLARQKVEGEGLLWASYMHYGNPTFQLPITVSHEIGAPDAEHYAARRHPLEVHSHAEVPSSVRSEEPEGGKDAEPVSWIADPWQGTTRGTPPSPNASTAQQTMSREESPHAAVWKKLSVLRVVILTGILVVLGVFLTAQPWNQASPDTSLLTAADQALAQRDWHKAETLFHRLVERTTQRVKGQAFAGLAAVAFARGGDQQALDFARQAERLEPEIVHSHVIRGHIFLKQGKLAQAEAEYRLATEKSLGLPRQQAVAHNLLGLISVNRGNHQQALEHYDRAIRQGQEMAAVYANKGHLLEKLGKRQEAMALYRRALQIDAHDPLTATLLREAERRDQLARDAEKRQRIDQLVAKLLQAHKTGTPREPPGDGWTSTPLTVAFLNFRRQGTVAPRAGEDEFVVLSMAQEFQASGRLIVVERDILDTLLAELKLGASELVDPQVALRVGRLLAARLLATGSLRHVGETGQLSVRLVETETTRIRASVTAIVESPDEIGAVVAQLSERLVETLRQAYPLQGYIVRITSQGVTLNLGAEQGMTPGLVMRVFSREQPLAVNGQVVDSHRVPVGLLEVTSVDAQLSQARVLEQAETLQAGWQVQEVQEQ